MSLPARKTPKKEAGQQGNVPWSKYRTSDRLTPLRAIRHRCLDCSNEQSLEVKMCPVKGCALWNYRFGRNPAPEIRVQIPSALRSMRLKCLDCATSQGAVRKCWVEDCPLYHYRFGKNPARAGKGRKGGNPSLQNPNSRADF